MDRPDKRRRLTHSKQIMKNEPIALNKETSHDGIDRKNFAILERIATTLLHMVINILFMGNFLGFVQSNYNFSPY